MCVRSTTKAAIIREDERRGEDELGVLEYLYGSFRKKYWNRWFQNQFKDISIGPAFLIFLKDAQP